MSSTAVQPGGDAVGKRLLLAGALGGAVALTLGIYGNVHDPTSRFVYDFFFQSTIAMKVWFATAAVAFAILQVCSAMWVYGKLPWQAPDWAGDLHRISGRLAFLISLPVAYHCLWSLGFQDTSARVLAHSILGCAFYGAFAAKVVIVRSESLPGIALPLAGGLTFAVLVAVWFTSAFWFITSTGGFPPL